MKKATVFLLMFCLFASLTASPAKAAWQPDVAVASQTVYMINTDTNTVVYEKNANQKVYPASLTKLMTAILTVEKFGNNLDKQVTVTSGDLDPLHGTGSSSANLKVGEQVTIRELLYCLLIPSANDAANVLARVAGGSVDNFVASMNAKAKALGATDTHYVNAHGLQDPDHYTTAHDMYLIAKNAMTYSILRTIVSTESYTMPKTNKTGSRKPFTNTNLLLKEGSTLYYEYCHGIKTGTTTQAGGCLVSYATKDGYTYYCVAMDGPDHTLTGNSAFSDSRKLFKWAFSTFSITPLIETKELQAQVSLELAWNKDHLSLYPQKQFSALIPSKSNISKVTVKAHLPTQVLAPVKVGQVIGTADVYLGKVKMGTVNLVSHDTIARSEPLYVVSLVKKFFSSVWFKIVSALLVLLFALFLLLSLLLRIRRKKKNDRHMKMNKKYRMKR
ncbi:MAG: D-alanyl-D-alanine carboxypeptidase [Clostridia bacterium]|nr:D-alanyl-D-alanine carboxypeptidase [Clostridia bacterium]